MIQKELSVVRCCCRWIRQPARAQCLLSVQFRNLSSIFAFPGSDLWQKSCVFSA